MIYKKYDYALDKLQDITLKIANMYTNMGAIFNVQIDSFVYVDKKTGNIIYIFLKTEKNYFFIQCSVIIRGIKFISFGWSQL